MSMLAELVGDASVLVLGAERKRARLLPASLRPKEVVVHAGGAVETLPTAVYDVVLITDWDSTAELSGLARSALAAVRSGGSVAFLGPTRRDGIRAITGIFRRPRPVALEEMCEALLFAGLVDIRVEPVAGAPRHSLVSGSRVP